jgi:hypothetical protein
MLGLRAFMDRKEGRWGSGAEETNNRHLLMGVERFCEIHGLLMSFCLMDNYYDTHGV